LVNDRLGAGHLGAGRHVTLVVGVLVLNLRQREHGRAAVREEHGYRRRGVGGGVADLVDDEHRFKLTAAARRGRVVVEAAAVGERDHLGAGRRLRPGAAQEQGGSDEPYAEDHRQDAGDNGPKFHVLPLNSDFALVVRE
jgi:hypothetical protein